VATMTMPGDRYCITSSVGGGQQRFGDGETECLRGLEAETAAVRAVPSAVAGRLVTNRRNFGELFHPSPRAHLLQIWAFCLVEHHNRSGSRKSAWLRASLQPATLLGLSSRVGLRFKLSSAPAVGARSRDAICLARGVAE
jgi:hypothetical protein